MIPAHDEESGIATTVRSCLAANYPSSLFDVLVIADNCTDRTAAVAASAGARVVERFDAVKKSKGYAIEYLIESLERVGRARLARRPGHRRCRHHDRPRPAALLRPRPATGPRLDSGLLHRGQPRPDRGARG